MFSRQEEDVHLKLLQYTLSTIKHAVAQHAGSGIAENEKFYLDALTAVLDKTLNQITYLYPQITSLKKENLSQLLLIQYDLISLKDTHRMLTGLKVDAPELTLDAVTRFYNDKSYLYRSSKPVWPNAAFLHNNTVYTYTNSGTGAPSIVAYAGDLASIPERVANAYTDLEFSGSQPTVDDVALYFAQKSRFDLRSPQPEQAFFLYKNKIYHYDRKDPKVPTLTPISDVFADTPDGREQEKNYNSLKNSLKNKGSLPEHAGSDDIGYLQKLKLIPDGQGERLRPISLDLTAQLCFTLRTVLMDKTEEWRDTRMNAFWESLKGALLIIGGLSANLAVIALTRYIVGAALPAAKIIIILKMTIGLGLAFLALGLGFALYAWFRERSYSNMAADFNHVQYETNSLSAPLRLSKSLAAFFQDHQAILDTAFPEEARLHI